MVRWGFRGDRRDSQEDERYHVEHEAEEDVSFHAVFPAEHGQRGMLPESRGAIEQHAWRPFMRCMVGPVGWSKG